MVLVVRNSAQLVCAPGRGRAARRSIEWRELAVRCAEERGVLAPGLNS
jgi:hypothetical protein